ncbi:hypothetical protein LPW11_15435 [Geomonas sp. RF6]|uniref:hypothetical protein n=1 Tax=Geomonas sp. RF6 TaxID=2897342 RepID=UPI001E30374F|nr:hypothetical protein [Geomonas sp. RF6]UFS69283.1 hypothetical protein LPW11_15435 [Geomonas sp. RF6]
MPKKDSIRDLIALEAARLMYEEGVGEYRDAKRKAAKRFGPEKTLSLGSHLPSNAEIHAQLRRLIETYEEKEHPERLLRLRLIALSFMEMLQRFSPYLVGSVLTGAVTSSSDIDIHLFPPSVEDVEELLDELGMPFETETVPIRKGNEFLEYTHIYIEQEDTEIECSVYPAEERNRRFISSITGKPMERAGIEKLKKIIAQEAEESKNG